VSVYIRVSSVCAHIYVRASLFIVTSSFEISSFNPSATIVCAAITHTNTLTHIYSLSLSHTQP